MTDAVNEVVNVEEWIGDALSRKKYADFLTALIVSQMIQSTAEMKSLTIAIDAAWGVRKTFFIDRCSNACLHPTSIPSDIFSPIQFFVRGLHIFPRIFK
jgi:hypothetical protein